MRPDRLRADGFSIEMTYVKFLEAELRLFPRRKQRLATLMEDGPLNEDDILHATPANVEPGMPRSPGIGRPTESVAMVLLQRRKRFAERAHLTAQVRTIQEVFDTLTPELQAVIEVTYFSGLYTVDGAAMKLGLDRKTVRLRCTRALMAFALVIIGDHAVQSES